MAPSPVTYSVGSFVGLVGTIVMIALEANTLVRFIAQDHPAPTAAATKLIWVLQFSYRFDKREIEKVIER